VDSSVKVGTPTEQNGITGVVTAAFLTDPMARWMLPEADLYLATMPDLIREFAGGAFQNGSAYYLGAYAGAALWLPPGVHPNQEAMVSLLKRRVPEHRLDNAFAVFDQMGRFHPEEPHWYLPLIGVDPLYQSRGCGSALMKHALIRCDSEKKIAYLESSNQI
jgi:ribosomal protein S18 acetylase RimI-like enzyme